MRQRCVAGLAGEKRQQTVERGGGARVAGSVITRLSPAPVAFSLAPLHRRSFRTLYYYYHFFLVIFIEWPWFKWVLQVPFDQEFLSFYLKSKVALFYCEWITCELRWNSRSAVRACECHRIVSVSRSVNATGSSRWQLNISACFSLTYQVNIILTRYCF